MPIWLAKELRSWGRWGTGYGAVPLGSALFINQGGYEASYQDARRSIIKIRDVPNHTYEHG